MIGDNAVGMSEAADDRSADPVVAGWRELRAGRWEAARERFEAAVAVEETPEALEGLSWAAWWLDDGDAVFAAREGAYRLYRGRADAAGAARMATWLAADQLDFSGAWAVASGWLQRARRLLDRLEPGPEHGWIAFHEGYLAHAAGDTATATELAARATELGREFGVADLEMLGLALQGATLVACSRVDEGMRCLDEATATALGGDAAIPISCAWTFCILVGACTAVLDFERAAAWCDRIAEFAERYGSRYMLAFCRAEYGAVDLWRGRWGDAEAMLEASVEDFSRSRPAWVGGPLVGLGRAAAAPGAAGGRGAAARPGGRVLQGPPLPRAAGAGPGQDAAGGGIARSVAAAAAAGPPSGSRARARVARSCPHRAGRARGGGRGRRGAPRGAAAGRHRAAARRRRRGRGGARLRPRRPRAGARAARGRRRRASSAAARRSRPLGRGSSWPRACSRPVAPGRPSARRPPR